MSALPGFDDGAEYEQTASGADSNLAFVRLIFELFCSYGLPSCSDPTAIPSKENLTLDSFRFSKFCRDAKLMKPLGRLGTEDVDLIFMKAKVRMKCSGIELKWFYFVFFDIIDIECQSRFARRKGVA